jgi:hypothetical protein
MPLGALRRFGLTIAVGTALVLALAAPSAAAGGGKAPTFEGAFEFQGLASASAGKGCSGEGTFGEMNPGARVLISERVASGDFQKLAKGKVAKGTVVTVDGDEVCRMRFSAKAKKAPASDSTIYLEIKGVAFNIQWPAADVANGDLGIWTCEFDDSSCATVVGRD